MSCFNLFLGAIRNAGSSLLAKNLDNPGLSGKFVVFLEKTSPAFLLFIAQTIATIAKSQSHSQNVFLKSKKGSFQWLKFSSECHRFQTGTLLSASYSAISGTKTFW